MNEQHAEDSMTVDDLAFTAIGVLAFGYVVTNTGATNISTGERCTFVSTPITPAAALCPNCGTQTIGERS